MSYVSFWMMRFISGTERSGDRHVSRERVELKGLTFCCAAIYDKNIFYFFDDIP